MIEEINENPSLLQESSESESDSELDSQQQMRRKILEIQARDLAPAEKARQIQVSFS